MGTHARYLFLQFFGRPSNDALNPRLASPGLAWVHAQLAWGRRALRNTPCDWPMAGHTHQPATLPMHMAGPCPLQEPTKQRGDLPCNASLASSTLSPSSQHHANWRRRRMGVSFLACMVQGTRYVVHNRRADLRNRTPRRFCTLKLTHHSIVARSLSWALVLLSSLDHILPFRCAQRPHCVTDTSL